MKTHTLFTIFLASSLTILTQAAVLTPQANSASLLARQEVITPAKGRFYFSPDSNIQWGCGTNWCSCYDRTKMVKVECPLGLPTWEAEYRCDANFCGCTDPGGVVVIACPPMEGRASPLCRFVDNDMSKGTECWCQIGDVKVDCPK